MGILMHLYRMQMQLLKNVFVFLVINLNMLNSG